MPNLSTASDQTAAAARAMNAPSRQRRLLPSGLLALLCATHAMPVRADTRTEEINHCRSGEIATWADGGDRAAIASSLNFSYAHDNAPPQFAAQQVEAMVARAAAAWAHCGVAVAMRSKYADQPSRGVAVEIEWSETNSRGHFGLANLGQRRLSLGPQAFDLLRRRNPKHDATQTLQMTISHEMGHFFGLMAHSRRCVDVLSYYHDGRGGKCYSRDPAQINAVVEYRHILPTACDIKRCRRANGQPPLPRGELPTPWPQ